MYDAAAAGVARLTFQEGALRPELDEESAGKERAPICTWMMLKKTRLVKCMSFLNMLGDSVDGAVLSVSADRAYVAGGRPSVPEPSLKALLQALAALTALMATGACGELTDGTDGMNKGAREYAGGFFR